MPSKERGEVPNGHTRRAHASRSQPKRRVPNKIRNEGTAILAEFCGTFMFLFFAFTATQVANASASASSGPSSADTVALGPNAAALLYISLAFGFSLACNVWIFYRVSGGLFNPAVTLGLYLVGAVNAIRMVGCMIAQIVAGICAAGIVQAILPGPLAVATTLSPGTSISRGCFLEMFLTAELMIMIYMLAVEKHKGTFLAPVGIGLALFVAELAGVYFTGGSLNPARSFGPAVILGSFPGYHWIYWIGPTLGVLLAFTFYRLMKWLDYETVNPGQDFNDIESQRFQPPENPESPEQVNRAHVAMV